MTVTDTQEVRHIALQEFFQFRCSWQWISAGISSGMALGLLAYLAIRYKSLRLPIAGFIGGAGVAGAAYTTLVEPGRPVLERVAIQIPSMPDALNGLRIGQISDMHLDFLHTVSNTRWAVQRMQEEQPDIIVLTGDFVSFAGAIPKLATLLQTLHAPLGIYAITGNHDHWEGVSEIRAQLEPLGITFLLNESVCLHWNGAPLWLMGIDDVWYGKPDLEAALAHVPPDAFKILLSHSPDFADTAAEAAHNIALQISGHTHGGHLNLPMLGWFCVPHHGLRYISGLEHVGNLKLYVTRGIGGMPLRLNCPPEATILTLQR